MTPATDAITASAAHAAQSRADASTPGMGQIGTGRYPPAWVIAVLATLRARWWLVALAVLAGFGAAVFQLRTADYRYAASLVVAPAPSSARESSGLGALTSLASLTGIAVEAAPATPFRLYLEGMRTREVANRLAADPVIMHQVFADEWDPRARRWIAPDGLSLRLRDTLYGLVGAPVPRWSPPDAARLQTYLATAISVYQNPRTPLATIGIEVRDRREGVVLLQRLHVTVDAWMREKTLDRTRQNIAYLNQRLPTVAPADHRQALFATLNDQEQRLMLARNPAAFAAEPFGSITTSPRPIRPRQLPTLALGLAAGLLAGLVLAVLVPRRRRAAIA
jgi:hypothetical protein